ncbi:MAG: hypothetical protein AAF497_08495 [Planctomycetota bacterium]
MNFSEQEIALARELRVAGLPWEPRAGHYVYDETGFCKQPSPFQENVYFILNYNYFMKTVGGVERFKEIMLWLPTWDDCRQLLANQGIEAEEISKFLSVNDSLESGTERFALYQLIAEKLSSSCTSSG